MESKLKLSFEAVRNFVREFETLGDLDFIEKSMVIMDLVQRTGERCRKGMDEVERAFMIEMVINGLIRGLFEDIGEIEELRITKEELEIRYRDKELNERQIRFYGKTAEEETVWSSEERVSPPENLDKYEEYIHSTGAAQRNWEKFQAYIREDFPVSLEEILRTKKENCRGHGISEPSYWVTYKYRIPQHPEYILWEVFYANPEITGHRLDLVRIMRIEKK